jgi:hypothetical protein
MPAVITAAEVEAVIRTKLRGDGYDLSVARLYGQNGTDIIATRENECLHIEVIAFKRSPPARAKDFYECFFRAVSRLEVGANECVIALPARFGKGLPQRVKATGRAWHRIGDAFPELKIWLINTEEQSITRRTWREWAG